MKIKLLKPHTHAHKDYQSGDVLEVSKTTADWLISNKVGKAEAKVVHEQAPAIAKPLKGE